MIGDLFINRIDAYEAYGISLEPSARAALMTPAANKDLVSSASRLEHGTRYIAGYAPRSAERDVQLNLHITARSEADFLTKYAAFCAVLEGEKLDISIKEQPNVTYRCIYRSCTQYQEWGMGIAKFTLRLTEPNPKDRD